MLIAAALAQPATSPLALSATPSGGAPLFAALMADTDTEPAASGDVRQDPAAPGSDVPVADPEAWLGAVLAMPAGVLTVTTPVEAADADQGGDTSSPVTTSAPAPSIGASSIGALSAAVPPVVPAAKASPLATIAGSSDQSVASRRSDPEVTASPPLSATSQPSAPGPSRPARAATKMIDASAPTPETAMSPSTTAGDVGVTTDAPTAVPAPTELAIPEPASPTPEVVLAPTLVRPKPAASPIPMRPSTDTASATNLAPMVAASSAIGAGSVVEATPADAGPSLVSRPVAAPPANIIVANDTPDDASTGFDPSRAPAPEHSPDSALDAATAVGLRDRAMVPPRLNQMMSPGSPVVPTPLSRPTMSVASPGGTAVLLADPTAPTVTLPQTTMTAASPTIAIEANVPVSSKADAANRGDERVTADTRDRTVSPLAPGAAPAVDLRSIETDRFTSAPRAVTLPISVERDAGPAHLVETRTAAPPAAFDPNTLAMSVAAPVAAHRVAQPSVDMTRGEWPQAMIGHIERLRDAADANDTRIRLHPDALGSIDVSLHRSEDRVAVALAADRPATQAILDDARPQLDDLAAARGLRLADASSDRGGTGSQRQPSPTPATPVPARPRPIVSDDHPDTPATGRIA